MNNVIVPRLVGGLGNQMFQVATAYALARRTGNEMAIHYDNGWYSMSTDGMHEPLHYKETIYSNIADATFIPEETWTEPHFSYAEIPPPKTDITLDGYFQSAKYFDDYRQEIKNLFCFDSAHDCSHLVGDNTVGVHIRRGDYLSIPTVLGFLDVDYYKRAIDSVDGDTVVVCSDDPEWAYQNFGDQCQISNFTSEIDDLYLLSQCKSSIISNSSFSWWGAYLGNEKQKVVAPEKWFGPDGPQDYQDVYLEGWIKL